MKKLFTCLFICFPFLVLAQSNYKKAVVVKNNGEILNGFIDYRERDNSPKYITFKTNQQDSRSLKLYPDSVNSFEIIGADKFVSYNGKVSMNKTAINNLLPYLDSTHTTAILFLKQLSHGAQITLYSQEDDVKKRYFIQEDDNGKIEELGYYNYLDQTHEIQISPYKRQLLLIAEKYNKINEVAAVVNYQPFNQTTLEKAVNLINNTSKAPKKNETFARLFIGAGLNRNQTTVNGDNNLTTYQSVPNYFPKVSAGVDVLGISGMKKIVFRAELSYSANKPQFKQDRLAYFDSMPVTETYSYTQNIISFTPQIIYNLYNSSSFKFFVGAGLGANISAYSNEKYTYNRTLQYSEPVQIKYDYKKFWVNFPLQTGLVFNKRFDVFVTYTPSAPYTDYVSFSASSSVLGAGLHYYLNRN